MDEKDFSLKGLNDPGQDKDPKKSFDEDSDISFGFPAEKHRRPIMEDLDDSIKSSAPEPEEIISRDSEACGSLWRRAAELFFRNLKADCPKLRILVIENYLAEEVGDIRERTAFPELQEIRRTNEILRGYYAFLREMLPEAEWISPAADELYFTDRNYEYGAIPSHLNGIENQRIGEMAESRLLSSELPAGS